MNHDSYHCLSHSSYSYNYDRVRLGRTISASHWHFLGCRRAFTRLDPQFWQSVLQPYSSYSEVVRDKCWTDPS